MEFKLTIDGTVFRDTHHRVVTLHGINLAADAKIPSAPDLPSHEPENFWDGDNVSFADRPFPLSKAPEHFARVKQFGFNTLRYIFTWEAIEAAGPGKYDEDFIEHTILVLREAKRFGLYVFMDPHQDLWSRFMGGCGAPMWTVYACGLDPQNFDCTEAALVQNTWEWPAKFPKMIWATNYSRLACQTVFTMFFAGRHFTPKAIINGMNIQDYLQNHFVAACKYLALRVKEAGNLDQDVVIGWESMNEPNKGLIGAQDLTIVPTDQRLQLGTSPSAWQAMLLGSGRACEIDVWEFGGMGPYKSSSSLIDPKGTVAWLAADHDDSKYGWKRDPGWKLGKCIWAHHGVWDPLSDRLLKKDYFARDPQTNAKIDYEYFTNHYFMDYFRKYKTAIREIFPQTMMFMQPPAYELPPSIIGTADDEPNLVYSPHWYDGLTLMNKKWNWLWNIDVFGVLREKYLHPAFALKVGEAAIRNCFRDQMAAIRSEGLKYTGDHPMVLGEFGIPYDMNGKKAYEDGDYSNQTAAMDANLYATEASMMNFTLWNYTASNTHIWGDQWNGEDLSVHSLDDPTLPCSIFSQSGPSLDRRLPSFSASRVSGQGNDQPLSHRDGMQDSSSERDSLMRRWSHDGEDEGFRAAEAFVRPYPIATHGKRISYGFDLDKCEFKLKVVASSATEEDAPTEIFLPLFHFPPNRVEVEVSEGKWEIEVDENEPAPIQRLKWHYPAGTHEIRAKGLSKADRNNMTGEERRSFLQQCREKGCLVM